MAGLLLSPFIMMFFLWLLARHEAELNYFIIFYVVGGVSVLAFVLGLVSPWLALAVLLLGLPFAVARWCYVSLPKAALVTVLYLATQIGLQIGWQAVFQAGS